MLRREGIDEDPLDRNSEPFESRRNVLQLGSHRENFPPIEICAHRKRNEFRSAAFDAGAKDAAGQESDLVAFGEQYVRDRKQRIEMACRGRRSDKNFHDIVPLIADKARIRGSPGGRDALRRNYPAGREAGRTVSTVSEPGYGRISGIGYCVTSVTRRRTARGPAKHSFD